MQYFNLTFGRNKQSLGSVKKTNQMRYSKTSQLSSNDIFPGNLGEKIKIFNTLILEKYWHDIKLLKKLSKNVFMYRSNTIRMKWYRCPIQPSHILSFFFFFFYMDTYWRIYVEQQFARYICEIVQKISRCF